MGCASSAPEATSDTELSGEDLNTLASIGKRLKKVVVSSDAREEAAAPAPAAARRRASAAGAAPAAARRLPSAHARAREAAERNASRVQATVYAPDQPVTVNHDGHEREAIFVRTQGPRNVVVRLVGEDVQAPAPARRRPRRAASEAAARATEAVTGLGPGEISVRRGAIVGHVGRVAAQAANAGFTVDAYRARADERRTAAAAAAAAAPAAPAPAVDAPARAAPAQADVAAAAAPMDVEPPPTTPEDDPCGTCGARPPAVAFGRFASSGRRKGTCEPCLAKQRAKQHEARQKPPNAMDVDIDVDVDADALERQPPNAMDVDDDPQDRAIDAEEAERRSGAAVTVAYNALDVAQAAVAAVTAAVAETIPKVVEFEKNACLAEVRQFDLFVCTRRPQDGDDARISLLVQGQPGGLRWVRSEDFAGACPFGLATFASVRAAHDAAGALRRDDAITHLDGGLKYSLLFELRSPPP